MPVNVTKNVALEVQIEFNGQPLHFECQVSEAELTLPGSQPGESVETACPDGVVSEPGSTTNGGLTGNVYVDPTDTGITWALATLYQAGTEFPYRIVYYSDLAETHAIEFVGNAKVNTFTLPFSKPGNAQQPLDLALITASMGRPAPAVV